MLEATARRGEELVEKARAHVSARLLSHERELQRQRKALVERLEAERDRKADRIRVAATREIEMLEGLSEETIDELARMVIARLVGDTFGGVP